MLILQFSEYNCPIAGNVERVIEFTGEKSCCESNSESGYRSSVVNVFGCAPGHDQSVYTRE